MKEGHLPVRLCNPNPFSVEVPQHRPLVGVTPLVPESIGGRKELMLTSVCPEEVEVAVAAFRQAR